jgi:peroxiredoxin
MTIYMRKIFLVVLMLQGMLVSAQTKTGQKVKPVPVAEKGFVITGTISGLANGTSVKLINANTSTEIASSAVETKKVTVKKNGKPVTTSQTVFVLKGELKEPDLCVLTIGDMKPFNLYTENNKIAITGKAADMTKWVVKGSASHIDFAQFEKTFTPLAQSLNTTATTINGLAEGSQRDSLMKTYNSLQTGIQTEIDAFITKKKSSYVSAFVLLVMMGFNDNPFIAESRLTQLDTAVQHSYLGSLLSGQIADAKVGAVGSLAMEFSQPDTSGNAVTLSSFRGKYVLVDFWASWCRPCREENPNVVRSYNKFKDKNFTVLGVSLDRPGRKEDWVNAIKEDNLTWTHVSDLQFWNNQVAKLYKVQGIPQNFLIDPNGVIVGKNLRGPELEAKLCEILGCN